jgi:hypothetical protein
VSNGHFAQEFLHSLSSLTRAVKEHQLALGNRAAVFGIEKPEVQMQRDFTSPQLLEVIRVAVRQVEQSSGVAPGDPAIVELKHKVVRTIGELEVAKAKWQDQDDVQPPLHSLLIIPSE